jgi:hypothetical protein
MRSPMAGAGQPDVREMFGHFRTRRRAIITPGGAAHAMTPSRGGHHTPRQVCAEKQHDRLLWPAKPACEISRPSSSPVIARSVGEHPSESVGRLVSTTGEA